MRDALGLLAGIAIPIVLCTLWLWHLNVLADARTALFDYNRAYLAVGFEPRAFVIRFVHELWRLTRNDPLWLLGMGGLAFGLAGWTAAAWRHRSLPGGRMTALDHVVLLGGSWLGAALIAAAANGARLYSTYFMPCLVPLSLLTASLLLADGRDRWRRLAVLGILAVAAIHFLSSDLPQHLMDTVAEDVRQWPWRSAEGSEPRLQYLEAFGSYGKGRGFSARANAELSAWLSAHSEPQDRIYIFGMAPGVYFTSRRLPAQRFLWIGPAASNILPRADFTLDAVAADLARTRPRYIIEEHNNRDGLLGWRVEDKFDDPSMRAVIAHCAPVRQIEDFSIYTCGGAP
jgi:hypothetical protein